MMRMQAQRYSRTGWAGIVVIFISSLAVWANAATRKHPRLTLEFRDPDSRLGKMLSYNAKTDINGKYKFNFIPMEPILLVVTAPNHQSFGRQFEITQQDQVIHVKLRKPQPLR